MRLAVTHRSVYRFDRPMRGIVQSHRLTPAVYDGQSVIAWKVTVAGGVPGAGFRDGAGDWVETVTVRGPVEALAVEVAGQVETHDLAGLLRGHRETVPPRVYLRRTRATRTDQALKDLAETAVAEARAGNALDRAHALCRAVNIAIAYRPGDTHAGTTAAEALAAGSGVCQDQTHALIAMATHLGIPARYVTGYLYAGAGDSDIQGAEASHAWAELHVGDLGWVGFDPTNETCPDARYIRLGSGLDATDAAPIRGLALGAGGETLEVAVAVQQVQQ